MVYKIADRPILSAREKVTQLMNMLVSMMRILHRIELLQSPDQCQGKSNFVKISLLLNTLKAGQSLLERCAPLETKIDPIGGIFFASKNPKETRE